MVLTDIFHQHSANRSMLLVSLTKNAVNILFQFSQARHKLQNVNSINVLAGLNRRVVAES